MNGDASFSLERQLAKMLGEKVEDRTSSGERKKETQEQIPLAYSSLGRSEFTYVSDPRSEISKKEEEEFVTTTAIIDKKTPIISFSPRPLEKPHFRQTIHSIYKYNNESRASFRSHR